MDSEPNYDGAVDLDRDSIPLNDGEDPTSLLFQLMMETGEAASMTWEEDKGKWRLVQGNKVYSEERQIDAIQKALADVRA